MKNTPKSVLDYIHVIVGAWRDDPRDDAQLLAQFVQARDEGAFTALLWRHGRLVWRTCTRILGDGPDAEDAFQTTFLILSNKASQLHANTLAGWLHQVARQTALNAEIKSRKSQSFEHSLQPKTLLASGEHASRAELYTALDEELMGLPERLRVPLVLHYLEGKSQVEVAHILGCARSLVQYRLAQAEAMLRKRLERRGLEVGIVSVGALLGSTTGASAVPVRLIGSTVRAALQSLALPLESSTLAALAEGAMQTMLVTKVKLVAVLLGLTLCLAGGGLLAYQALAGNAAEPLQTVGEPGGETQASRQSAAMARVDCYGDPLPTHALARMGTVRQWYGRLSSPLPNFFAFLPDGKTLVSQREDGSVYLWDAATGKEIRRITNDAARYRTPWALSPDGRTLVMGREGTLYFWEVATGKFLRKQKYQGPKRDNVQSLKVDFLSDGKMLCLADFVKSVDKETRWGVRGAFVWDVATSKEICQLSGPGKGLFIESQSVAFSPDGKVIAATEATNSRRIIHLWEVATGKKVHQLQLTGKKYVNVSVCAVTFSPDGKTLAAGFDSWGAICVWDVATGKLIRQFEASERGSALPLAYSPDGKTLLGGREGHLWDVATGKEIRSFGWKEARVVLFSPNGKVLAVGEEPGVIRLWEVATGKEILPHKGHHNHVFSIAYSPDGKTLASSSCDVRLWEVATGKEIRQLVKCADLWSDSLAYSPDGKMLASIDDLIRLWDPAAGKEIRQLKSGKRPRSVVFSPDGKLLAATVGNETVCLWQVATGKQIYTLETGKFDENYSFCAFSPDGRMLAASGRENAVSLWDVATGKLIGQLQQMQNDRIVRSLAFSPDGRTLATSSMYDDKIRLWEMASGKEIGQLEVLKPHCPDGCALAFSLDGRILATAMQGGNHVDGSIDPRVHLWDVTTGREIGQLAGHRAIIRTLAFSPDGKTLASGSEDLTCLVWDVTPFTDRLKPTAARPFILQALSKEQLKAAWADLARDPAQAYVAIRTLQAAPTQAIPLLRERLRPVAPPDPQKLKRWISDLDDNSFTVREKAQRQIEKLGELALPALRQTLKDSPVLEVKRRLQALLIDLEPKIIVVSPQRLRELRAVQVLESIGTVEARQVLQAWAKGAGGARLTVEAHAALARSVKRSAAGP